MKNKKLKFNERRKLLDIVCIFFSFAMPATAIPQIYLTYATQDVSGVSLWMWVLYFISCIPFLIYGIAFKIKPLLFLNVNWLIVQLVMIVGILMYQ